jgi:DNA replication and repair protein RecF
VLIKSLKIEHLRNISYAELDFSKNINVVVGENGAGKTALLEAIYLLGRAKSFRSSQISSPIQKGQERLNLFATIDSGEVPTTRLGLTRKGNETKVKINGNPVTKLSRLANILPLALVTPQSHRIIEEGPENRRKILNWGVFHVEHTFKSLMRDYSKSLLQRNSALRKGSLDLSTWSNRLVEVALSVSKKQLSYFTVWREELLTLSQYFPFLEGIEMNFKKGWQNGAELNELLENRESSDREKGFTSLGPHRADIHFKIDGLDVKQILSRGQQKVLIIVLLLSQARVLERACQKQPIFLLDDLESELDLNSLSKVCELLEHQKCQLFITSLNALNLSTVGWSEQPMVFHVEHGHF